METYLILSPKKYYNCIYDLVKKLKNLKPVDACVGIARGGVAVAETISRSFDIEFSIVHLQRYNDERGGRVVLKNSFSFGDMENVFLVDDIVDKGTTMLSAMDYLRKYGIKKIVTATLFYKPWSKFKPDVYVKETTEWVVFPSEYVEFAKYLLRQGYKKGEVYRMLKESIGEELALSVISVIIASSSTSEN